MSTELARDRAPMAPGIQLRRFDGVLGRESGAEPGTAKPPELAGLANSRPLLDGRPFGVLGALLAKSWLTDVNEGGGGRLSKSKRSMGLGMVRGSEPGLGVETCRVGREWLRRRRS